MMSNPPFEAYFDFDNTITDFDVLDDIIQSFSINDGWKAAEEEWAAGKIGSKECLEKQLALVRVTEIRLREYLHQIRVDPAFSQILDLLRRRGVPTVIVSDSFAPVIRTILENNGVAGINILANEMRIEGDKPFISFPYHNAICSSCGNCKTSHLLKPGRQPGTKKIYVGDGRSDICPAGFCEVLFAKGSLYKHYTALRKDCIPFENLSSVYDHLTVLLK